MSFDFQVAHERESVGEQVWIKLSETTRETAIQEGMRALNASSIASAPDGIPVNSGSHRKYAVWALDRDSVESQMRLADECKGKTRISWRP